MNVEIEQKYRALHGPELVDKLKRLNAEFEEPIEQADQYFSHPARDFAKTDEALRLRRSGEENRVTYKGPKHDAASKTRNELELPLPAGKNTAKDFTELFTALGFSPVREVRKQRRVAKLKWKNHDVEVALDEVDGLGQFVELEFRAQADNRAGAIQQLAPLAAELGLKTVERRSYLELLLAKDAGTGKTQG